MGSPVIAIALADFQDRVRRYSFLITFLFSIFLGYGAGTGAIAMRVSNSRGLYSPAWIGTSVALIAGCFISLAGDYVVKNSVERDRATGVGQILAASPMSRITYACGKWISNMAVLLTQLGVLAVGAVLMFWLAGEEPHVNLWQLLSPFLLLAAPMLALTAACAAAFEMLPGLRGSFGNVTWFFLFTFLVSLPAVTKVAQIDPMGFQTVMNSLKPAAQRAIPDYSESFSLGINDASLKVVPGLRWQGIAWLVVAQLAAPLAVARGPLLAIAWIWPVLIWSAMVVREVRYGTRHLIACSPHSLWHQFPSCWL